MKQYEAVIMTMERLGGIATLGQLYQEVFNIEDCVWNTRTPSASIRRIVQTNNKIYKIKPGLYALESYRHRLEARGIITETSENRNSEEVRLFNHTYYQGLLITIGNLRNYKTFAPNQDKNKRFANHTIGDIRNLQSIPNYTYDNLVRRSSTIDVIWFNERNMPSSFFEVKYSTDFQNSLIKFSDLQDFNARMYIVADKKRYNEFQSKLQFNSFSGLRQNGRVLFLSFEELEKQYQQEVERASFGTIL